MRTKFAFLLAIFLFPLPAQGQSEVDLRGVGTSLPLVSRADLEESLAWHQAVVDSAGTKDSDRQKAQEAVDYLQDRLEKGDFKPGDQILFYVEGEEDLPDTLVVELGPAVLIPNVGSVPLNGVLRSELQDHLLQELVKYIRNPVVRVKPTIRLTVGGYVNQPGFYTFAADLPIGEAIMMAGGPSGEARIDNIKVRREGLVLYDGEEVQVAIAQGQTFDQMGLRAGDEVFVPEQVFTVRRLVTWGMGIASVLLLGFQIYGGG